MKYKIKSIFVSLLLSTGLTSLGQEKVTTYVNPFIGTGAVESSLSGNNYPGATVPFGMVQLSPDTRVAPDWGEACGYNHNDQVIVGFSHTRLSGTGAADFIDILLMPMTGTPTTEAQNSPEPGTGYQSAFSHDQESARPGYYQVMLQNYGIQAELTATNRVGIHRYTYPEGSDSHVILDLDHSANKGSWGRRIINSQIRIVDPQTIEGLPDYHRLGQTTENLFPDQILQTDGLLLSDRRRQETRKYSCDQRYESPGSLHFRQQRPTPVGS